MERAFDHSKYGEFSREPYLDLMVPTVADPSLAPAGKHIMSIYVQFAPYELRSGSWKTRVGEFADCALKTLSTYAPDLPNRILHQQVITPADIETAYGATGGHIFHGELTLEQFFTMRPLLGYARYRTPIAGLYMCGSGTHPGSGLTGRSGENAAREIIRDLR
jgi:phytoene dehydrogenase-like protein